MLCLLAMNDDKVPAGKYAVSTSNRNLKDAKGLVQERY
jgi:homoaconitase/3-isopropylmalate dehydratase large subunit